MEQLGNGPFFCEYRGHDSDNQKRCTNPLHW
jgi:hypothetical protein